MFFGEYQHNVDKKGRAFIPSKFREELGESFMICRSIDSRPCLRVYSAEQWAVLDEKLRALPARAGDFKRKIYSSATSLECDSQGRILIPVKLREFAGLGGEASFIGMSDFFEVWNPDNWNNEDSECSEDRMDEIAEEFNL
ncbi:MAG: division/cell wall cluster transcriptional repressor MraZ [Clostridia bacterium]|nr:division/cell wall cluster transcriptional repressor MraZ [Clostridia bacterium]